MPRVDPDKRARLEVVSETFSRIVLRFGFMETPNVPQALAIARKLGWHFDIMSTTFFLSRRTPAGGNLNHAALAGPAIHHAGTVRQ